MRLKEVAAPVVLNGPEIGAADVVPTTLNVSFPGCRADLLLMALDLAGVACSTGSACSSGSLLPSPVLRDGRAGRHPSLRASLQLFPSHEAGDPGRGGGVYRGGGEKRTGEHRDQGISDFARVPGLLVEDGSL